MIQKTKLKKKFNEAGLQITKEAINALDRKADLQVDSWVKMTKENNVKRLTVELLWAATTGWPIGVVQHPDKI